MEEHWSYEKVLALAEALPPGDVSRLVCELSKFLHDRYGKWTELHGIEEVREYIEWLRYRDSRHADGRHKSPEEFLAELQEDL